MKNKNVKKWGSIRRSPRGSRGQRLLELAFLKFQEAAVPHPWNGPTTVPKQEQLSDLRGLSGCQDCQLHSWKQNPSRAAPPMMRCRAKERSPGDKEKPLRSGNRPGKPPLPTADSQRGAISKALSPLTRGQALPCQLLLPPSVAELTLSKGHGGEELIRGTCMETRGEELRDLFWDHPTAALPSSHADAEHLREWCREKRKPFVLTAVQGKFCI